MHERLYKLIQREIEDDVPRAEVRLRICITKVLEIMINQIETNKIFIETYD